MVGRRVEVFWSTEQNWFTGTVRSYDADQVTPGDRYTDTQAGTHTRTHACMRSRSLAILLSTFDYCAEEYWSLMVSTKGTGAPAPLVLLLCDLHQVQGPERLVHKMNVKEHSVAFF